MHGDLRRGFLDPDLGPEIDHQDDGRLARFGKWPRLDNRTRTDIDLEEILEADRLGHRPSSSLRSRAAATARAIKAPNPSGAISTSSAACVVPLGEVTFSRNRPAGLASASISAAAPITVCRASAMAVSALNPCASPA